MINAVAATTDAIGLLEISYLLVHSPVEKVLIP